MPRRRNPSRPSARRNPSTTVMVGGSVALLAVAVGAWWWMRGRSPDERLLVGDEGGGRKRKFDPSKLKGALATRPSLKALTTAQGTSSADASASGGGIDLSQRGVAPSGPPPGAGSSSSYFYVPPTR